MAAQGVTAYAQIHATVRALYAKLLSRETWYALAQVNGFEELLDPLSKTVYGPYLQIATELLTPRRTAYQIQGYLADIYAKLIRLTREPGRQLMLQLWRLYEVDNLKATLRGVETGSSWDQVRHLLSPVTRYNSLTMADLERMILSRGMVQAIERTEHTPYYNTLSHAVERYQKEHNLFPLEVALDLDYRRGLWESINRLSGRDYEQALHLVGTVLDVDNLLWAIRYRVYHHLSAQEIINYTLPFGYQVSDADIRAIASGEDIVPVVRNIYPGVQGLSELSEQDDDPAANVRPDEMRLGVIERALQHYIVRLCRSVFIGYPFHIGIPLAYLLLLEHEVRDLTTLIEAKASGLPLKRLVPLLGI